jgi:hypothetical protein
MGAGALGSAAASKHVRSKRRRLRCFQRELEVKNRHPLPYPWNVGLYGYDGIRVERTGCIRAGRRPCPRDLDSVGARCVICVSNRLAVDNIRDIVDNTITPVHSPVKHAARGIATYRESDGENTIWYTLECARTGCLRLGLQWESGDQSHKH